jgi:hypothetical protein
MRKNKYRGAGFFTRYTNSKPATGPLRKTVKKNNNILNSSTGPRLQPKVGSSDSERGSASRGPLRKTFKKNNNVVKSSTGPLRKTIRNNNNVPSGPIRKGFKKNIIQQPINMPVDVQIQNIPLNVTNIDNSDIISAADENTTTLQHLWNEVYGNGRYDELFDYVLAGKSIDFSTVPKDEGWIQDLKVYLIGPSASKIKTLMNFAPTRSLLSKSLGSLGIDKDFITILMNRYKQLSNDDKMKFIEHLKNYAEQYASTASTLRIE